MTTGSRHRDVPLRLKGRDPLDSLNPIISRLEALGISTPSGSSENDVRSLFADLMVAAAVAVDISRFEQGCVTVPEAWEFAPAVERAGLDGFTGVGASDEEVRGFMTAVRGAAGEQWVLEGLRNGSLPVPPGTSEVDLLPFHTPGVDLRFMNTNDDVLGTANVKIAKSAQVVVEHFERHPDVNLVYASSDAADDAARLGWDVVENFDHVRPNQQFVVDIGRSSQDFDREITSVWDQRTGSSSVGDAVSHLPWFASGAIAMRALVRLRRGQKPARVVRGAAEEAVVVGDSTAATTIVSKITASEPILMATAFLGSTLGFGILRGRQSWLRAGDSLEQAALDVEKLARRFASSGA